MTDETKQTIGQAVEKGVEAAEEAVRLPAFRTLARLGFYSKGFLFIVIGVLAISLVVGLDGGKIADATGALSAVSQKPYGKVLLIIFVIGAIGHGAWNILRGAADIDNAGTKWQGIIKRCVAIGAGFFYLGLSVSAFEIVLASRVSDVSSHAEETFISIVLAVPLIGTLFVVLVGLGVIGAGFNECYSGFTGKFRENYRLWEITGFHLTFINILGFLSFTARAVLLVLMGYFFIRAAFYRDGGAIGMDAALLALLRSSYGRILVLVTAIGLFCHGVLAFYEARYRRIC
ncbi:MAG: DUF1206 domain-containing protein [Acidobacteriota bacterium]